MFSIGISGSFTAGKISWVVGFSLRAPCDLPHLGPGVLGMLFNPGIDCQRMVAATKCRFPWRVSVSSVVGKVNTLCETAVAQHIERLACSIFFGF